MKNKYMVFMEDIKDGITGIELKMGEKYLILNEDDNTFYIDCDIKNQKNIKKEVKFKQYGFEKQLNGKIFNIINE